MSNSRPSSNNTKFWLLAGATIVLSGTLLASLWPAALWLARNESVKLSDEAARVSGGDAGSAQAREAETDYHLAYWLDHRNAAAALHFATAQLVSDQPQAALKTIAQAGEGSEVRIVRLKAYLELGNTVAAVVIADQLAAVPSDINTKAAVLAYGVGEKQTQLMVLEARVSSPEALQAVKRAEAGQLPLAVDLYATGLLRSSSALLMKLPASKLGSLYLGRINFHWHTKASLATAADYYASAVALDPSDIQTRTEYAGVLTDLGRDAEADKQRQLMAKLAAGTP